MKDQSVSTLVIVALFLFWIIVSFYAQGKNILARIYFKIRDIKNRIKYKWFLK